jgi:hypothetical protein
MPNETFLWKAHYTDGTTLDELDDDGVGRPFAAIDLLRLAALELLPQQEHVRRHILRIDDGRPIFFRRRRIELDPVEGIEVGRSTVTCLGYQTTIRGRNMQLFLFLFGDGSTLLTDNREAV